MTDNPAPTFCSPFISSCAEIAEQIPDLAATLNQSYFYIPLEREFMAGSM